MELTTRVIYGDSLPEPASRSAHLTEDADAVPKTPCGAEKNTALPHRRALFTESAPASHDAFQHIGDVHAHSAQSSLPHRRTLSVPLLHFIASFFPSAVLPPDLRHLNDTEQSISTARHQHQHPPSIRGGVAATLTPPRSLYSLSGPPFSAVQRAIQEEKPPVSLPLAFIASNPQCRRARELHGCVLPPQGSLVIRLVTPVALLPTPEARLAASKAAGQGGGGGECGAAGGASPRLHASSLPASLFYTKRGHWFYDGRYADGGAALQRRHTHTDDDEAPHSTLPGAVLLVVSRNANTAATMGSPPPCTVSSTFPTAATRTAAATTVASPTTRRSPGLLPVFGSKLPTAASASATTIKAPLCLGPSTFSADAAIAADPGPTHATTATMTTTPSETAPHPDPPLTEAMQALSLASWWIRRNASLSLSLNLQSYSAEQTLYIMTHIAALEASEVAPTEEADPCDVSVACGDAVSTDVNDKKDSRGVPVVWSAHSLLDEDNSAYAFRDDDDNDDDDDDKDGSVDDARNNTVVSEKATLGHDTTAGVRWRKGQSSIPRRAPPPPPPLPTPATVDVTEITIRASGRGGGGGGGVGTLHTRQSYDRNSSLSAEPRRPSSLSAMPRLDSDSKALTLLLAQYPELRSLSLHNSSVTGDGLEKVSRACQHVSHLSLGMNPALHTTRFLAPSVTSTTVSASTTTTTTTTATTATKTKMAVADGHAREQPFDTSTALSSAAGDDRAPPVIEPAPRLDEDTPGTSLVLPHFQATTAMAMSEQESSTTARTATTATTATAAARAFAPHTLSTASIQSLSRGLSFSLDTVEAAAQRDARLSPHERRQLALVVRPADVHMGGVDQGVGNLQDEKARKGRKHAQTTSVTASPTTATTASQGGDLSTTGMTSYPTNSSHTDPSAALGTTEAVVVVPDITLDDDDDATTRATTHCTGMIGRKVSEAGDTVHTASSSSSLPFLFSSRGAAHHVDPDALLRELSHSPARRDVREEVRQLASAAAGVPADPPEEDSVRLNSGKDEVEDGEEAEDDRSRLGQEELTLRRTPSRVFDDPEPVPVHDDGGAHHRRQRHRMPSHSQPRRQRGTIAAAPVARHPSWASTLLELDLSFTAVHTADLATYVPRLRRLRVLWLEGCAAITSVDWVPRVVELEELNLSRCDGLAPTRLWPLRDCAKLQRLSLARLSVLKSVAWLLEPPPPPPPQEQTQHDDVGEAGGEGLGHDENDPLVMRHDGQAHLMALPQPHAAAPAEDVAVYGADRFLRRAVDGGATAFTLLPRTPTVSSATDMRAGEAIVPLMLPSTQASGGTPSSSSPRPALCASLTQLDLSFTGITRDGLTKIGWFPYLTSLSLHGCRALADTPPTARHNNNNPNNHNVRDAATAAGAAATDGSLNSDVPARAVGDALACLHWLAALDLSHTLVGDSTVAALTPLLQLNLGTLLLANCRELTRPPAWLHASASCGADDVLGGDPLDDGLHALTMTGCPSLAAEAFGSGCFDSTRTVTRRAAARADDDDEAAGEINAGVATTTVFSPNGVVLVRLRGCDGVRDVLGLAPLCWVTELDLYHTAVTTETLVPALRHWRCLETLILASTGVNDFSGWVKEGEEATDRAAAAASARPPPFLATLRYLDLSNTPVTSDGIAFVARCPQLHSLWLRRCRGITHLHFLKLHSDTHSAATPSASSSPLLASSSTTTPPSTHIEPRTALRDVVLTDAHALAEDALEDITLCASRLQKLVLANCGELSRVKLLKPLVRTTLVELDLSGSAVLETDICDIVDLSPVVAAPAALVSTTSPERPQLASDTSPPQACLSPTSLRPSKPTTPPPGTPSPRRLSVTSLTPTGLGDAVQAMQTPPPCVVIAPPSSCTAPEVTPRRAVVPSPALRVLRLRGCRHISAELKSVFTQTALQESGFTNMEKVYL